MVLAADDYFDLNMYHQRVKRSREAWAELLTGKRSCLVFMNLCAPFLCDLFGVEPRDYYTDLEVMADTQLKGIAWRLEHLDEDEIPLAIFLDQGTVHEAIAFNLPIEYRDYSTPWGGHLLTDINQVDTLELPGLIQHKSLFETLKKLEKLRSFVSGLPVITSVHLHAPFTMAAQLFNVQDLLLACYEQPAQVHKLLNLCVSFFLSFERVKWQYGISPDHLDEFICWRECQRGLTRVWTSDDTAIMLSPQLYLEFVLPYNRMLYSNFEYVHLHMDGRWNHLIPYVEQLQPDFCEVGGETDWQEVIKALGATTILQGGILAEIARDKTPDECSVAASKALDIAAGKARVALTIANEVHPGTPLENMQAVIKAGRIEGKKCLLNNSV
jgi:uroporphyrinogen-III decarboxylase